MSSTITDGLSPIGVQADKVRFLHTPTEFYETLQEKTASSKNRIVLTSLYLGTGELEQRLVRDLEKIVENNNNVKVKLLFDYLRGTRGGVNSTVGLLSNLSKAADVFLFHTPDLRGYVKKILPERVNEVVGLQHMKFFIFDDSIVISGANLSDTYFTNRQDRYVLIDDAKDLADFFESLFDVVSTFSLKLMPDGTTKSHDALVQHPLEGDTTQYRNSFISKVSALQSSLTTKSTSSDTLVYPFLQMGPFGINQEKHFFRNLFKESDLKVTLASGYLNPYDEYADLMTSASIPIDVIFASPEANGFYEGQGISGYIPTLYVYISKLFYEKITKLKASVRLYEFSRPEWSFHAKGLWIEPKEGSWAASVVGSSNFGYRSVFRDLEAQLLIVTTNEKLKARMTTERQLLIERAQPVDGALFSRPDHYVPLWVRYFSRVFRNYF